MRDLFTALCLLLSVGAFAQDVLIPYKSGDKFGLCDSNAKVILTPQYDQIDYLEKDYFRFGNREIKLDTFKDSWGDILVEEIEISTFGLLKRNQVLIPLQELPEFIIYEHFIAASESNQYPENFDLYNLRGEKILPHQFNG